jgi:hypothetical protein
MQEAVERIAAELLRSDAPTLRTGSGLEVRLHAAAGDANLRTDVERILRAA